MARKSAAAVFSKKDATSAVGLTERLEKSLHELFGFRTFHPGQLDVITRVMEGQDTLAILATGAGKSLCYQLPALLLEGTTIVVSPLIALMKDQLDMLSERGFKNVVALNSSLSDDQEAAALARIERREIKIVYVTPEKLEDEAFMAILKRLHIPLFVVDEAHCISAWGHDFRPAYLALGQVIGLLGKPTVLALTATATRFAADSGNSTRAWPEASEKSEDSKVWPPATPVPPWVSASTRSAWMAREVSASFR